MSKGEGVFETKAIYGGLYIGYDKRY